MERFDFCTERLSSDLRNLNFCEHNKGDVQQTHTTSACMDKNKTENPPLIGRLLSYEYQRMWLDEREQWKQRMYPENETQNVDIIKRYVLSFKSQNQPPKPEIKKPFKMKKFERISNKISTKRPPGDKAMKFLKKMPGAAQESST